jgi:hypothetical protein
MSTEEVKAEAVELEDAQVEGARLERATVADARRENPETGGAQTEGAVNPKRPKPRRMRDMAMSMAVLLVPIGLFFAGWQWVAEDRQVSVVDTTEDYATAASLGLAVIEPELSEDWKPISSDLAVEGETVTLRTGWYSPEGDGLQVVETNGAAADVNEDITGAGTPVEAAGVEWAAYDLSSGEAWVAELGGETIVLSAEPDGENELPELAEGVIEAAGA